MVDSALRSSRRMSRLVADLLLLARADAGRVGARRRCDLAEIAGNAAAEVGAGDRRPRAERRERAPAPVEGNPDELHRMVLNLLDNAVRHTPAGLHASSCASRATGARGAWSRSPTTARASRRASASRSSTASSAATGPPTPPSGSGTGLGLAIVRAVATSHGGEVEVGDRPAGRRPLPGPPAAGEVSATDASGHSLEAAALGHPGVASARGRDTRPAEALPHSAPARSLRPGRAAAGLPLPEQRFWAPPDASRV